MTTPHQDSPADAELEEILNLIQARTWVNEDGVELLGTVGHDEAKVALEVWKQRAVVVAQQAERKAIALDNYQGQTFSADTDYRCKFDKFVRNNEKRIAQLDASLRHCPEPGCQNFTDGESRLDCSVHGEMV